MCVCVCLCVCVCVCACVCVCVRVCVCIVQALSNLYLGMRMGEDSDLIMGAGRTMCLKANAHPAIQTNPCQNHAGQYNAQMGMRMRRTAASSWAPETTTTSCVGGTLMCCVTWVRCV